MARKFHALCIAAVMTGLLASSAFAAPWSGSGTYTVGTGGDYATLGDFFFAMNGTRQGRGTIAFVAGATAGTTTTITGTGTLFTSQSAVNDYILARTYQIFRVRSIASDTSMVVDVFATTVVQTASVYEIYRAGVPAVSGNVTVEILGNLTEPDNIPLIGNLNGFSLTVKPAAAATPTVSWTRPIDNPAFSGHILVGNSTINNDAIVNGMDNITFDGSNNGTTSRDLTFFAASNYDFENYVHILGTNDNIVVKNMNLIINNTLAGGSGINYVRATTRVTATALAAPPAGFPYTWAGLGSYPPQAWKVLNCNMTKTAGNGAHQAVNSTSSGTIPAGVRQAAFEVKDNYIFCRLRGVFLNQGSIGDIQRNKVLVIPTSSGFDTFGILLNNAAAPPAASVANYTNNAFEVQSIANAATYGPHGLWVTSAGSGDVTYNVINNMITLRHVQTAAINADLETRGIYLTSGVRYNVINNSIYVPNNPLVTGLTPFNNHGIGGFNTAVATTTTLKNNIVSVNLPNMAAIKLGLPPSAGYVHNSDYNDFYVSNGAVTGHTGGTAPGTSYATLLDWQTASSKDANSKALDPSVPGTGGGKWCTVPDLHFAGNPGPEWAYANVAPATDIDGETRNVPAFVGADDGSFMYVTVASARSSATTPIPQVGDTGMALGATVNASAANVAGPAGTRYVPTGYVGTGSAPTGSGTSFSFVANLVSTITWSWQTQHTVTTAAAPPAGGSVGGVVSGDYYNESSIQSLSASANAGWFFTGWTGDLTGTTTPQNLTVDAPKTVTANFSDADIDTSTTVDLGQAQPLTTATVTLVISNLGTTPLTVSALNITGADSAYFSAVATLPLVINGGSTGNVTLRLVPDAVRTYNATLTIVCDDGDEASFPVALTGDGVPTTRVKDWLMF